MNSFALVTCLALCTPSSPQPSKPAPAKASSLADKVQGFYDRLEDYEARFVQTYTRKSMSRTSESSGVIQVKKGGKVHWAYEKPEEKLFVADGKTLWIYEPYEEQVVVDRNFDTRRLNKAVSFLWGDGKLRDSFEVKDADAEAYGWPKGAPVLELVPKTDRTFVKLVVRVDPQTGRVEESILFETVGNTNRFRFYEPKLNQGLPDARFEFVPPAGVDVVPVGPS